MEKYALFTYESLKKTKCREFVPSRDEIEALISRQEMTSTVYCHGGGSCKITINSHTTAGEVRSGDRTALAQNHRPFTCQFQPGVVLNLGSTGGFSTGLSGEEGFTQLSLQPPAHSEEILAIKTVFILQRITQL